MIINRNECLIKENYKFFDKLLRNTMWNTIWYFWIVLNLQDSVMILRSVHVLLTRIVVASSSRYRSILFFAMELVVFRYLTLSVQTLYFSLLKAFSTRSGALKRVENNLRNNYEFFASWFTNVSQNCQLYRRLI